MKIQLYLDRIDQEMINSDIALKMQCEKIALWKKQCCVLDFSFVRRQQGEENGLMLRKEETGGYLWDARSGAVYLLDEEAYNTILGLESGFRPAMVAKQTGTTNKKINALVSQLRELGLYA